MKLLRIRNLYGDIDFRLITNLTKGRIDTLFDIWYTRDVDTSFVEFVKSLHPESTNILLNDLYEETITCIH